MKKPLFEFVYSKNKTFILKFFNKKKLLQIFSNNLLLPNTTSLKFKKIKILFFFFNFKKLINLKRNIFIKFFDTKSFLLNNKIKPVSLEYSFLKYKTSKYFFLKKKFKFFRIAALILSLIFFTPFFTDFRFERFTLNLYRFYRINIYRPYRIRRHAIKKYIIRYHFYHY
jgi:hypothetical protein